MTSPDLIGRDFTAQAPGTRLVGDITYLHTGEGWLYLSATVIDLATKMVTGWQLADHMRTSLVTDALAMAITHGHVAPGATFHRDHSGEYLAIRCTTQLAATRAIASAGTAGYWSVSDISDRLGDCPLTTLSQRRSPACTRPS